MHQEKILNEADPNEQGSHVEMSVERENSPFERSLTAKQQDRKGALEEYEGYIQRYSFQDDGTEHAYEKMLVRLHEDKKELVTIAQAQPNGPARDKVECLVREIADEIRDSKIQWLEKKQRELKEDPDWHRRVSDQLEALKQGESVADTTEMQESAVASDDILSDTGAGRRNAVASFYEYIETRSFKDAEADQAYENIRVQLFLDRQQLHDLQKVYTDPLLSAHLDTLIVEIDKELLDVKIAWLHKKIYELGYTPDRQRKIEGTVSHLERGPLHTAFTHLVGALHSERSLLEETRVHGGAVATPRVQEIRDQIKELENEFESRGL